MHTASPGKPLSNLDSNIKCGNSLVGPDFYAGQQELPIAKERERVNAFEWKAEFRQIFDRGGFDCVVDNPPYVKLQHFRRVHSDVANYLTTARRPDGSPLYESSRTGNFDLYLPFIEKGIDLLKPNGRMGFIAPNVWMMNDYGQALRAKLRLIVRLNSRFSSLGNQKWTRQIFQGLITSADHIYHLQRVGPGLYKTKQGQEVPFEDAIMHAIVSGKEAKRYQRPKTNTFLLFPYDISGPGLFSAAQMARDFPNAWKYLKDNGNELRNRERGKMDSDDKWWGYNYPKNLSKHAYKKLMVPRLVSYLFCAIDTEGEFYLDNVVGGILVSKPEGMPFLAAILNAPVFNFVWRRISKLFQNDYRSANKQFIAPLPIPDATDEQKSLVAALAMELQDLHTRRGDHILDIEERLNSTQMKKNTLKADWLWADIRDVTLWKKAPDAPQGLEGRELTRWAREKMKNRLQAHYDELNAGLRAGAVVTVENTDNKITLRINGAVFLRLFDLPDTQFVVAQWRHTTRDLNITDKFKASKFVNLLLKLRDTNYEPIKQHIVELDNRITMLDNEIARKEAEINEIIYDLYDLSQEERVMIEHGGISLGLTTLTDYSYENCSARYGNGRWQVRPHGKK